MALQQCRAHRASSRIYASSLACEIDGSSCAASAGAAFLHDAGGYTLSTEVWRLCNKLEGRWLRAMTPRHVARGTPWHEWAPAATRAARARARRLGFPSQWERCCKLVYSWAGHLPRAPSDQAIRCGHEMAVPLCRCTVQAIGGASGDWRHTRSRGTQDPRRA